MIDGALPASDYFEPWHPEEGQRVRVRLNPECRHFEDNQTSFEGRVGTVIAVLERGNRDPAHRYRVVLDGDVWSYWVLAAVELELIDGLG
ncbi:MAG: hypothetical protein ACKVVP_02465 [Chloroflexota bacterium]